MIRTLSIVFLLIALAALMMLHLTYGLGYVARVYVKQDSDTSDIDWKPQFALRRSSHPSQLPKRLAVNRVTAAFEDHSAIDDLHKFLVESETTSLIVAQNGSLIYESYFNGLDPGQPVSTFSVSKSVFSMMLGRAINRGWDGFMDESLSNYLPELTARDPEFSDITATHLINMRSGIAFDSDVTFPFYNEDKPLIYYADDLKKILFKHPEIESAPGPFHYNDFNPNLLALAFERATNKSIKHLLQTELWTPIGAEFDAVWMTDSHGFPLIDSGLGATPVDLVRIGQIMLDVGEGSSDFIPNHWHKASTVVDDRKPIFTKGKPQWHYQQGWWIMPRSADLADYSAIGHLGQYIYVSPQSRVVVVRTGYGRGSWKDEDFINLFFKTSTELRQN